ncbi:zinc finger protein 318-like [Scomber scombrus]|uniref:zinc finger protein 318-like n=1 Tax=Scomber scombrus TaxID=13677 RepID=UPI002DDC52AE|nr:zinc finger protein 318-like [Scomber scombrus]XP_062289688.1 zinc finger protein 318-like [Scomber scombrus]
MNPLHWEDNLWRLPRNLDPNHQSGVNNSSGSASTTRDTYCQYSRYTVDEPHSSTEVNLGWNELNPPSHNFYSKESEAEDTDGAPLEMDEEDPELTRKRKELKEIEEQIMRKKFSIALKTVEPIIKKTMSHGYSSNEQSDTCKGETLRDRVNAILQQRHSLSFVTKSAKERLNSSRLSKGGGVPREDHPLKLRVKALMKQRLSDPCDPLPPANCKVPDVTPLTPSQSVNSPAQEGSSTNQGYQRFLDVLNKGVDINLLNKVPDVTLIPPSQIVPSPAQEESSANKGFQRFLDMLNKGVDIELLSRIVNDDSEDLTLDPPNLQIPVVERNSHLPFMSESQQSHSGTPQLSSHSRTKSGERKADPPSREQSHNESQSLPDEEKKNNVGRPCFGSSSRSKSPPAVKKTKKEEEVKPKANEQQEQLQNILKTLGLSLEVEEMSKLADRTQERLYGKKHDGGRRPDTREEQESPPRASHKHYSKSSSSSSSSRSTSSSHSPSRHPCSHSQERGRASERSRSRDRNRNLVTCGDGSLDDQDGQRYMDKDGKDSKEMSFQHPYPQNQLYPPAHPPTFPAYPDYSMDRYSEQTVYHNGSYSTATNSYWTYSQDAVPSPLHPSGYPYPQSSYHHFPGPVMTPNMVYPHQRPFEDMNLLVNPDLSKSEGQMGSLSGPRCLQVIRTKQLNNQSCRKQLTKSRKRKGRRKNKKSPLANPDPSYSEGPSELFDDPDCVKIFTVTSNKELKRRVKYETWLETKKELKRLNRLQKQVGLPQTGGLTKMVLRSKKEDQEAAQQPAVEQPPAEQPEEEKRQPTEEEVKANLRKKLEAFNQMAKKKVPQPAPAPDGLVKTSEECLNLL